MSAKDLQALSAALELGIQLNRSILERLKSGAGLETLDELFAAKASSLEALKRAAAGLNEGEKPSLQEMALTHDLQASLARTEGKLTEALGERQRGQKNVSAVTKAYGSMGLDKSGQNRLDFET
jgi:hypothetical protein